MYLYPTVFIHIFIWFITLKWTYFYRFAEMESAVKIFPDHAHESNDNHQQESKTSQSNELTESEQVISGTSETESVEFEANVEDLPKPHITINKEVGFILSLHFLLLILVFVHICD